jgi:hypothetical protein
VKKSKTKKILDEASYYTGAQSGGSSTPETASPYEFSKDSVPTLNKVGGLKNQGNDYGTPQELPYPLQDSIRQLADLYLKAQELRNAARKANELPFFKGREAKLEAFRKQLNGIMVECKKLATSLHDFSLAPK